MNGIDLFSGIVIVLSDLILAAAVIYGVASFFLKKSPLYFRILTLATVCYAGTSVFRLLYRLCYREDFPGMGITLLGIFGCYLFLFSANYGQYDSLIDDRSPRFRKYRVFALAAPLAVLSLLLVYTVGNAGHTTAVRNVMTGIGFLPAVAASYYNFKHFIIPDMGFHFVRWVRRANLCALVIEVADIVRVLLVATVGAWAGAIAALVVSACFFAMLVLAGKGRQSWLQ